MRFSPGIRQKEMEWRIITSLYKFNHKLDFKTNLSRAGQKLIIIDNLKDWAGFNFLNRFSKSWRLILPCFFAYPNSKYA